VLLLRRLSEVGLGGERPVEIHENRTVLVSITKQGALRLHRGFAYAPDRILQALVVFAHPEAQAGEQRRAEQAIVAFPTDDFLGPGRRRRRPERVRPGDRLGPVPIRLSRRMRTRLGELTVDPGGHQPLEIAVSRQHVEHDGWEEVMHTLLHEMVHQWQVESGQEADHGPGFRRKAREVGVEPVAMRDVRAQPRPA
jgi:hypothetical protein